MVVATDGKITHSQYTKIYFEYPEREKIKGQQMIHNKK